MFPTRRLDRDLVVDRTKVWEIEDISLTIPSPIRIGTTATLEIVGYTAWYNYEVSFSHGTFTRSGPMIYYTADANYFGTVQVTITVRVSDIDSFVIFEDGTVYNQDGDIAKAEKIDGKFQFLYREVDYEEDLKSRPAPIVKPPIPTTKDFGSSTIDTFDYSIFGSLGSYKLRKGEKDGDVADYKLPSEKNKAPDEVKYLYNVEDNKFITVPRNSNVTESTGDVFSGYRTPGEVGGSLTITKGESVLSRTFNFQFDIKLWDLIALLPDEIVALCLNTLSISPSFRGNTAGHVYEWEQIDGDQSNVYWVSAHDDPNLVVNLGALKVDRKFRFWISRGTEYEKSYIVVLYGTPVTKISTSFNDYLSLSVFGNHLNIVNDMKATPIVLDHEILWHKQLRVNVIRNY